MVKLDGYLIITFDLPGMQIEKVEEFLGCKLKDVGNRLAVTSSRHVEDDNPVIQRFGFLNCGYLVIKK